RHPDAGKRQQVRTDRPARAACGRISKWRHATRILSRRRPKAKEEGKRKKAKVNRPTFFLFPFSFFLGAACLASREPGSQGAHNPAVAIVTVKPPSLSTGFVRFDLVAGPLLLTRTLFSHTLPIHIAGESEH